MRTPRTLARVLALALTTATLAATQAAGPSSPATAAAGGGTISSAGPLTNIVTSADLNCSVNHAADTAPEFYGTTACGTLVAVEGTLYGPAIIPAGNNASPRTGWTPVSQTSSGAGTSVNPYRVITVVTGGPLTLTQTDSYVVGDEAYATRISVENTSTTAHEITLYRAADCYLQNSDRGYGRSDAQAGSVACVTGPDASARIEQWAPQTPGSHFYEAGYDTVWSRIGSQQPFPDTSADSTYTDNGAGLSWTATIAAGGTSAFAHLTAFSPSGSTEVSDSDGDGFPDSWEEPTGGVDTNGDGAPDLKLSDYGATPNKPDVFVQANWTQTRSCVLFIFSCSTRNRHPSLAALSDVQTAFKRHGIRLHIDAGADSLMNPDTGAKWGNRTQVHNGIDAPARVAGYNKDTGMNWSTAYDGLRARVMSNARARIFHEALYVGDYNGGSSGVSRSAAAGFAGRDFLIAVDDFDNGHPTRQQEAGTFMHELGHNLGLSHGGSPIDAYVNYKPNFPSLMNYFWQMSGTFKAGSRGLLDYSEGTLDSLNESALNEAAGLSPDSAAADIFAMWACPNGSTHPPTRADRNLDWDCSGGAASTSNSSANVTGVADSDGDRSDTDLTTLRDHNDWAGLVFDGGGALGGAGDPASAPDVTPAATEPASTQALLDIAPDLQPVTVTTPGQIVIQSGTAAPVQVTLHNPRSEALTFDLTQSADGVTLTGVPNQVTLTAGETRTLDATIEAAAATDNAYFEIDAAQGEDPSNTASAVTEVYVVDQTVPGQPANVGDLDHVTVTPGDSTANAGSPVTYTVTGYDAADHDLGPLSGATLAISPDGSCSAATCSATTPGAHTVTATSGTKTAQATLTVTPAAPATVSVVSGNGQRANPGASFSAPLVAKVVDAYGNPVPSSPVTFTIDSLATFPGATKTAITTTGADGQASAPTLQAGNTSGAFTVSATDGAATGATFTESVAAPGSAKADLAVTLSAPARATRGQYFTAKVRVTNGGPSAARGPLTSVTVPAGVQVGTATGARRVPGAVVWQGASLASGASATYALTMRVTSTKIRGLRLYAAAISATRDPLWFNNLSTTNTGIR